jgi:hypothetical protein
MKYRESHEGTGTGLDLRVEEVMAQALAILEPGEPYLEVHMGEGTGLDLNAAQIIGQIKALLEGMYDAMPAPEAAAAAAMS